MARLRQLLNDFLANGKIESNELEMLRTELYADGKVSRDEINFLAEMHKRVQRISPAFEKFFFQAVKDHVLQDGTVTAEETAWLRQMLFHDGKVAPAEVKFLRELRGECKEASPEFTAFCEECLG